MTSTTAEVTFADALAPLLATLPAQLVGEAARTRIARVAVRLPQGFTETTFGFECRLHERAPDADILVSAQRRRGGAALRASPLGGEHDVPAWRAARALGAALDDPAAALDDVWLEFDVGGAAPEVPNLFLRPLYRTGDAEHLAELADVFVPLLAGAPFDGALRTSLLRCARALPPRALVFQIGAMRARRATGLRVCVREISLDAILRYLEAISYPGEIAPVRALLVRLQPLVHDVTLDLDLTPELQPRLGFECYIVPGLDPLRPRASLRALLDDLVTSGSCTADKARALQSVTGDVPSSGPAAALLALHRRSVFERRVHHVKVVYRPGAPLEAKAYLAARRVWR